MKYGIQHGQKYSENKIPLAITHGPYTCTYTYRCTYVCISAKIP